MTIDRALEELAEANGFASLNSRDPDDDTEDAADGRGRARAATGVDGMQMDDIGADRSASACEDGPSPRSCGSQLWIQHKLEGAASAVRDALHAIFETFGEIVDFFVAISAPFAYVCYRDRSSMHEALRFFTQPASAASEAAMLSRVAPSLRMAVADALKRIDRVSEATQRALAYRKRRRRSFDRELMSYSDSDATLAPVGSFVTVRQLSEMENHGVSIVDFTPVQKERDGV